MQKQKGNKQDGDNQGEGDSESEKESEKEDDYRKEKESEADSVSSEEEDNGSKIFMEGIGYERIDILNKVQKIFNSVIKDFTESIQPTNEDILEHVKYFERRNMTYGLTIQEADALKNEEIIEENDDDEYLIANAVQIKIFCSDLIGFSDDDDKSQLSKMFSRTFVIAMNTKIKHIKLAACRFWCLDDEEYDIWYRSQNRKPYGVVKIDENEYGWTA